VLVLTINETKPFFFLIDGQPTYNESDSFLRVESPTGGTTREAMAFGYRRFVGRRGAVHIGFSSRESESDLAQDYAAFSIGYTQYDLFGTRAFATLNLKKPIEGYGEGGISPQLVVGVPLSANQTLTLQFDETRTAPKDRTILGQTIRSQFGQRLVTAKWSYNTTNEPFFPTRGTLLHVTPAAGWSDSAGALLVTSEGEIFNIANHSTTYGAEFGATQYRELNDRDSVWGNVRGEWAHIDQRDSDETRFDITTGPITVSYGSVGVGYSRSLWSRERRANGGDSRVEATLRYSNRSRRYPYFGLAPDHEATQVGAAWIRRTSWGTARLGLGYAF
jgi:outer membrane protein assembly factor BamA